MTLRESVIASHYVSSSCEDEDSVHWGGSSIGKLSVKSAISLIRNEDDPQCDKKWHVIWKAPVSERIKMFLWLAVHDRLLTNVQRVTRKLTNDTRCTRCGVDEESLDHILRRCPSSFMIWNKLGDAGEGGILRDDRGHFIRAFAENYGVFIASHYVSSSCEDEDSVHWGGSSIGKLSVKSAISLIRNEDDPQCDKKWHVIRKAPVSERIKMFLWLAVHDRLLTNVQRVTRKLTNDPRCTRWGVDEESLDHILRRCPSSFMIWNKLGTHPPISSFWTLPLCEWIVENLSTSHANNDSKGQMMFAITLWWLWKWRNTKIFGRDGEIPIDPIRFLHTKLKEMSDGLLKDDMRKQGCYKIR
nr:LURP1-like domain-containing protein [Tanacetum cinerariifolium]